ncbi:MAG TPA: hypothetical protein DFK12_04640 [Gallionellaceae bacterium]|nr:hypothetical protein [Gallionellaceae bacterium]
MEYPNDEDYFPSVTYDRAFMTLFVDGVHLLVASENAADNDISNSFARGSLACTMMLPEVVANILIETLHLESSTFSDVDKMSAIGKFDFYLRTSFRSRKLDRGMRPVQALQELKRLRDIFVHPKAQTVRWTPDKDSSHTGESDRTPLLDMSKNPTMWYSDDAIKAMRAVHEFFAYYFRDLCHFGKGRVSNILFSQDAVPDKDIHTYHLFYRHFVEALRDWKVDISYFKIGVI